MFATGGRIGRDTSGGSGIWYRAGDRIPASNVGFYDIASGDIASLYGSGATPATFPISKFNGVAITKWNGAEITKWNGA